MFMSLRRMADVQMPIYRKIGYGNNAEYMEIILQVLMLFIIANCALKLSFRKWWYSVVFGLICGAFVIYTYPFATQQSKTQLVDYLANRDVMQDMAVLITLEAALWLAYCFLISKRIFGGSSSRWTKVLDWYVSLLVFPVLFDVVSQTIYAMPGTSFTAIAWIVAACSALAPPLLRFLFRLIMPEDDFRLEVHFLMSLFVCILGLITTVNGNVTYAAVVEPVNYMAILYSIALFTVMFAGGYVWNRFKW